MDREALSLRFYVLNLRAFAHVLLPLAFFPRRVAVRLQFRHAIARVYLALLTHLISVCTQLRLFSEKKLKHTGNVFLYIYMYIYNSFFWFSSASGGSSRAPAARGEHACVRENVRGWAAHEWSRAGVRFDVSTLQSTSARDQTTRGIKDVDCYRCLGRGHVCPDPRESREVVS